MAAVSAGELVTIFTTVVVDAEDPLIESFGLRGGAVVVVDEEGLATYSGGGGIIDITTGLFRLWILSGVSEYLPSIETSRAFLYPPLVLYKLYCNS